MSDRGGDEFVVSAPEGARCRFHSREFEANGWLACYVIELEGVDFRAAVPVIHLPEGTPPSDLFTRLAAHASAWPGREAWASIEGELAIEATCDRTGHVTLVFTLRAPPQCGEWSASATYVSDFGQLDRLARGATAFFERPLNAA